MSLINFVTDMPSMNVRGDVLYQGTVVNNNDPLKIGRVKVRVPQLLPVEAITDSQCPWAVMKRSTGWGGNSERSSFFVPEVGSKVLVQFNGGDIYSPIYETCPPDNSTKITDFNTNYPNRSGWKDPDGNILTIDSTDNTLSYVHSSGFEFHVRQDKNIDILLPQDKVESISRDETKHVGRSQTVDIQKDCTETITGNVVQDVGGTITITAAGNISISGLLVKLGITPIDFVALKVGLDLLKTQLDSHIHSGVTSGGSNTGAPTTTTGTLVPGTHYAATVKAI